MFQLNRNFVVVSLMSALSIAPALADVGVTGGAGTWKGEGVAFDLSGKPQTSFTMTMVNKAVGAHELDTVIDVVDAEGNQKQIKQTMTDGDRGFSLQSDLGNGGGYCLGDGICEAYLSGPHGHAYALTIIIDSPTSKRLVLTELQNDKAVRILREKFVKTN